jgi:competence protein ComFC
VKKIFSFLLNLIFPPFCCSCQKLGKFICDECYEDLHFLTLPIKLKLDPLYLDQTLAAVEYTPPITSLIYSLKYDSVKDISKYCAHLLYYSTFFPQTNYITAVPLSKKRQKLRGFNQGEEIAKELEILTHIPYKPFLYRIRDSPSQASLSSKAQRLTNLKNTFGFNLEVVKNISEVTKIESVLIIDDVITTGTTLNECAKVLKENGVKKVIGLAVAHR